MNQNNKKIREIGGFFEFPSFDCEDFNKSTLHYLTNTAGENNYLFVQDGRQAIKTVLEGINDVKEKKCYLPAYICHSIIQPFREMKLNIDFYDHKHPLIQNIDEDIHDSVILIIDYFGTEFFLTQKIQNLLHQGNKVIIDITHSILDGKRKKLCHENLYYISSLRKIFPIPDGAVIYYSHNNLEFDLDYSIDYLSILDAMVLKDHYLSGTKIPQHIHNVDLKNEFLSLYAQYEERKDRQNIHISKIPLLSLMILSNLTFNTLLERRNHNLLTIYGNVSNNEIFLFNNKDIKSPFMLPLLLNTNKMRENLKTLLIKNNIYPPIHWNIQGLVPKKYEYEHQLNRRLLSIPIDQRYSTKDMIRITNILNEETV